MGNASSMLTQYDIEEVQEHCNYLCRRRSPHGPHDPILRPLSLPPNLVSSLSVSQSSIHKKDTYYISIHISRRFQLQCLFFVIIIGAFYLILEQSRSRRSCRCTSASASSTAAPRASSPRTSSSPSPSSPSTRSPRCHHPLPLVHD